LIVMKQVDSKSGAAAGGPTRIRLACRIWLHDGSEPVFGMGIRELLVRVESTGSLRQAALDMGMAYSKAWQILRRAEEHLGFALLDRRTGGRGGGGSIVSDEGRLLAGSFGALVDDADALLDGLVEKHLSSWIHGADDAGADGKSGGSPARDSE